MKKVFIIIFVLSVALHSYTQTNKYLILTKNENDKWLEMLKYNSSLESKIKMVNERMLNDTNIYIGGIRYDSLSIYEKIYLNSVSKSRERGEGKPVWLFQHEDEFIHIYFSNFSSSYDAIYLTGLISEENIKYIDLFTKSEMAEQIYGGTGNYGVIWIRFKSKRIFKQVKQLNN